MLLNTSLQILAGLNNHLVLSQMKAFVYIDLTFLFSVY